MLFCLVVWVRSESNVWCFWVFQRKLPSTMPTQFNATYTPIGSGSSEGIMKHLARLMAVQMVAAGVGPGVLEVNRRRQVKRRRTFSLRLSSRTIVSLKIGRFLVGNGVPFCYDIHCVSASCRKFISERNVQGHSGFLWLLQKMTLEFVL